MRTPLAFLALCLCFTLQGISQTIINKYAAVLNRPACSNDFEVDDAMDFNIGDTVLLIQMKGATIDSSNTTTFGTILNYNGAGNYEYNIIKAKAGNILTLLNEVTRQFDIPWGKVQLVKVPYFQNYTVTQSHSCAPWDGSKGGVFAITVGGTLTLNDAIDVTGKGFRAGDLVYYTNTPCSESSFKLSSDPSTTGALKGEGIFVNTYTTTHGRGANANGGGGGNTHNGGGGGGANGGAGGNGGNESQICVPPIVNGGIGGFALNYSTSANKIFLGGGAGAGHANNAQGGVGGDGGGLVLIKSGSIEGNNNLIIADGITAIPCLGECWDGQAGGGAGGTVLIEAGSVSSWFNVSAKGGKGADLHITNPTVGRAGPGGGGGGGVFWYNSGINPPASSINVTGGERGVCADLNNDPWGSTHGQNGVVQNGLILPPFTDSFDLDPLVVNFSQTADTSCLSLNFIDATLSNAGITSWEWFMNGTVFGTTSSSSYTFPSPGVYQVKLIVVDLNGCTDSITKTVNITTPNFAFVSNDTTTCAGQAVTLVAGGGIHYSWSPANTLSNPNSSSTIATPFVTTVYTVAVSDSNGCIDYDSVVVTVLAGPSLDAGNDTTVCEGATLNLQGTASGSFVWKPGTFVSDSTILNPQITVVTRTVLRLEGVAPNGCSGSDSIIIDVHPPRTMGVDPPNYSLCMGDSLQLQASGGDLYTWAPSSSISQGSGPVVTVFPTHDETFYVTIMDTTCGDTQTVAVDIFIEVAPELVVTKSNDINCEEGSAQLAAIGAYKYTWSPPTFLNDISIPNPITSTRVPMWYHVVGETLNGCKSRDSVFVDVDFTAGNVLFVPTAFTPNNDGINDCFRIVFGAIPKSFYLAIYNRFGEIVHESHDIKDCWNGSFKGMHQPVGTFFYYYRITTESCGELFNKGDVHLLR